MAKEKKNEYVTKNKWEVLQVNYTHDYEQQQLFENKFK